MAFIGDSRTMQGAGILPLQHHRIKTSAVKFPLHHRAGLIATRIVDRKIKVRGKDVGHWVYDERTPGDVLGGLFWDVKRGIGIDERPIPAWMFSAPVIVFASDNDKDRAIPIIKTAYDYDRRFFRKKISYPRQDGTGKEVWNRFPIGTIGIMLTSTEHDKQEDLFFHADPRLISANRAGLPDFSSWVYETDTRIKKDKKKPLGHIYDADRRARLHSFARVIKYPKTLPIIGDKAEGSLAWQQGISGLDKAPGYGAVYFYLGDGRIGIVELTSQFASGFYGIGSGLIDKHLIGLTTDGEPITPGHISTNAYFHRNLTLDAPLKFEDLAAELEAEFPFRSTCHIVYDPEDMHDFFLGKRKGKWKVQSTVPYLPAVPTPPSGPEPTPTPPRLPDVVTPSTPRPPEPMPTEPKPVPVPTPSTKRLPDVVTPSRRKVLPQGKKHGVSTQAPSFRQQPDSVLYHPWLPGMGYTQHIIIPQETAYASMIWKPQQNYGRTIDLRYSLNPSKIDVDHYSRGSPIVLRMESFGDNDCWNWINTKSNGRKIGRYPGGTAPGGIYFMPPELDLSDYKTGFARPDIPISDGIVGLHPNISHFYGIIWLNPLELTRGFKVGFHDPEPEEYEFDDFDDNELDPEKWTPTGNVSEQNQRLEFGDGEGYVDWIARSYPGDFDVVISFSNLIPPDPPSPQHIKLAVINTDSAYIALQRGGQENPQTNRYSAKNGSTIVYSAVTTDTSGKLRLKRTGNTISCLYWSDVAGWVTLHSGTYAFEIDPIIIYHNGQAVGGNVIVDAFYQGSPPYFRIDKVIGSVSYPALELPIYGGMIIRNDEGYGGRLSFIGTADRDVVLPDKSGMVAMTSDTHEQAMGLDADKGEAVVNKLYFATDTGTIYIGTENNGD
jgi:hypothetical protein